MSLSHAEVRDGVIEIVREMTADWDLDVEPLEGGTRLDQDLCFSSVDVLNLFAAIDVRFQRRLRYERLIFVDGAYRSELTVDEIAAFVEQEHDDVSTTPQAM